VLTLFILIITGICKTKSGTHKWEKNKNKKTKKHKKQMDG
jgi:hypothetical protein